MVAEPGQIAIILAGRYKGKRVIVLKEMSNNLLLVTGPFRLNGVPVRRVNRAYVILTRTKIDISGVDVAKFDDAYFKKDAKKAEKSEEAFFESHGKKLPKKAEKFLQDQKVLDAALLPKIKAVPMMKAYLKSSFSVTAIRPHQMRF
ncbi:putative 60S ribosomal protein L6-B [Paratrimastix pyriformis]|uniref:60S ribosomal protein L6-B n=1 Tax=Paratrimastix pyriformis TaxID=342808 RepID=A0ABQ8UDH0_9EUKA|nr:putative 60S ribosomal protein L6-B [Paratrimastix pyriformis]